MASLSSALKETDKAELYFSGWSTVVGRGGEQQEERPQNAIKHISLTEQRV